MSDNHSDFTGFLTQDQAIICNILENMCFFRSTGRLLVDTGISPQIPICYGFPPHGRFNLQAKIIKPMDDNDSGDDLRDCGAVLNGLCEKSVGLSGRSLRKIPFLAYALFLTDRPVDLARFLHAMELAVEREHSDRKLLMKT